VFDYYQWYVRRKLSKRYLFFHAREYSIIALVLVGIFYYRPVLLAAAMAYLGHVATDCFHNGISPWGYSITYRAFVRFETARVAPRYRVLNAYTSRIGFILFGNMLRPWYERKIVPWIQSKTCD